jgi:hypothetical protein
MTAPLYLTILRQAETIAVDLAAVDPVVSRGQLQIEDSLLTEINSPALLRWPTSKRRSPPPALQAQRLPVVPSMPSSGWAA